jgi:serine/threonine protein kinase
VLYEMATSALPFRGDTSAVISNAILEKSPVPAIRLNPDISPKREEIISKALEKDAEVRYQHASDLRADLKRLKRGTDTGKAAATGAAVIAPAVRLRSRSRFWIAGSLMWLIPTILSGGAVLTAAIACNLPTPR